MDIEYVFDIDYGPITAPVGSLKENLMITEILPEMLAQIRKHFARDGINETKLIAQCKVFKDKYIIKNEIPTARDRKKIEKLYHQIAPYRIMAVELAGLKGIIDHLPILRDISEAMCTVYDIFNKRYYSTVGNPNLGQKLWAIVEERRKKRDLANTSSPGHVDASKKRTPVKPVAEDLESYMVSSESTPAGSVSGGGEREEKRTKTDVPAVAITDFSHMRSFTPEIAFDMSSLYSFLVDEGVIVNIDEKLFTDCISHAHINELWENADKRRKRNLLQSLFKMLARGWYTRKWLSTCASNLNMTVKQISNPTRTGATDRFEKKLWAVLRGKNRD